MAKWESDEDHGLLVSPSNGIIHRTVDPGDCTECIPLDLSATSAEIRKEIAEWRLS